MNKKDYLELAKYWNYERNDKNGIYFEDVTPGSGKKVWWKCENGHEWEASPHDKRGCPVCSGRKILPGFNDLTTKNPQLASEWNYEKNGDFKPQDFPVNSEKKVWWKCREGHEWEARIVDRNKSGGCPICSGHRVLSGFNDLASKNPLLASEWNYGKNGDLKPQDVTVSSSKSVWWKCRNGHEWKAQIASRNSGNGCPICSGREALPGFNDLATVNPQLASEWNYAKNGDLKPQDVTRGGNKAVWWKCRNGHEWKASIHSRNSGIGCPVCSGKSVLPGFNDLATVNPELASEWNYERNNALSPQDFTANSNKKVWWKCKNGHEWEARILSRNRGNGCPICSNKKILPGVNDLATTNPELATEWNYEKNGDLKPQDVMAGGGKMVWWKCKNGHEWEAPVYSRNLGIGCPICTQGSHISFPEKAIFFYIRQVFPDTIENYKPAWLGKMELDIYIPSKKVGIEYDGIRYHKNKRSDIEKDRLCSEQGITLIRIREKGLDYEATQSTVFTLPEDHRSSGKHLIPGLKFLEKQLGVDLDIDLTRDYDDIRSMVVNYDLEKSIAKTNPELLDEWDYEKNEQVGNTPENISAGSGIAVWWKCKNGHSYRAAPNSKTSMHYGCPYCNNKRVLPGFNDLATVNPELASEWNYERNDGSTPQDFTIGSDKKVWWKCKNGHEWEARIANRKNGSGCPYCAREKRTKH